MSTFPTGEFSPEVLLDTWLASVRHPEGATGANWRRQMLLWRLGPFARGAENRDFLDWQRAWCEEIHKVGIGPFFSDPAWRTPHGVLANIIAIDQFPRAIYRGTPLAYERDVLSGEMARKACEFGQDIDELGIMERNWLYVCLSHSENWDLQKLSVDKYFQWTQDVDNNVPASSRKMNLYVSWSFIRASIEHSEVLLNYNRFPHRNPILGRVNSGGEMKYLNDPMRPLWTFTQQPDPAYFGMLAALTSLEEDFEESAVSLDCIEELHKACGEDPAAEDSLLDVFDLPSTAMGYVDFSTFYRHLLLAEKAEIRKRLYESPFLAGYVYKIKEVILKDPNEPWPPRSLKHSIHPVIDVRKIKAIVDGNA